MHLAVYQKEKARPPQIADPLLDAIEELGSGGALNHLRAGVRLEMAGSLEEGAREQESAVNIQPDLIQAHINLISLYGKLGLIDQARRHYHQAMAINPNQSELHFNFGVVVAAQDRPGEAAAAFGRALEINPFYAEAYANLGQAMERLGRQDEAVQQYHKALENRPNYQHAYFLLGRAMLLQNKPADAIPFFIKALVPEDEHTPLYLFGLATAYAASGDHEQAISRAHTARLQAAALGQIDLVRAIDQDLPALERPGIRQ
ncbi:MAG: tetratricopeptide repeat protein [Bryobacteraceae bacterium]